jgi:hypothetical protein
MLAPTPGPVLAQQPRVSISADRLRRAGATEAVLSKPIRVISDQPDRDTVQIRNDAVLLARGEMAIFRTVEPPSVTPGPIGEVAPDPGRPAPEPGEPFLTTDIRFVTPDANLTGEWVLRPVYKVANRMRWEPDAGVFRGALFLAIEDSLRRSESRPLPTPVRFQLLAEADTVNPAELSFEHTNFPLRRVEVTARRASDSLRVHLIPEFDVEGTDIWLPVVPFLEVETTPLRIQGWGVQTAQVVVRVAGTTAATPTMVNLTSSSGELEALDLQIGAAGSGATSLRSAGAGEAVLRASAPGLGEATTTIVFVWPWVFLLAALLGGVFGGVAAAAQHEGRAGSSRWSTSALKGLFVGVLAALAWYALGVNLLQLELGVPRQNELAVFALAALAGFFGVPRMKSRGAEEKAMASVTPT